MSTVAPARRGPAHATHPAPRHRRVSADPARRLAAVVVLVALAHGLAVGLLLLPRSGMAWGTDPVPSLLARPVRPLAHPVSPAPGPTAPGATRPVAPAVPAGLSIPAIGVEEGRLAALGRAADGSMEVPADFGEAGSYTGAVVPGEPGPAVIAGHVDSTDGPAVFHRLRDLRPGDVATVRLTGGRWVTFTVDGVRRYPKAGFPTAAVFGPVPGAALRLVTCGGGFDPLTRTHRDNVVVYASLR